MAKLLVIKQRSGISIGRVMRSGYTASLFDNQQLGHSSAKLLVIKQRSGKSRPHDPTYGYTASLSVSRVRDPETKLLRFIFQIQDITDRKRAEAQLVYDAFHDGLTGLPNRALFVDHLKLAVARNLRHEYPFFSVLFLDLDRFKVVNDSLG